MKVALFAQGSFGDKNIPIEMYFPRRRTTNKMVVLFHGCGSEVFNKHDTHYQAICKQIASLTQVPSAIYESSRYKLSSQNSKHTFLKKTRQIMFAKTLDHELDDARSSLDKMIIEYRQKYKINPELIFIGFSLGGIVATVMATQYKAKSIITFGTATKFNVSDQLPIIGSSKLQIIMRNKVRIHAEKYKGDVAVIRGINDKVAKSIDSFQFMKLFKVAGVKSYEELSHLGHRAIVSKESTNGSDHRIIEVLLSQINPLANIKVPQYTWL